MAIGSRLIIRRLWPLKPTDKFLFYFTRHKLEISFNNAQAVMIHGSWTSDQASKSFERGSRATAFCKYHGRDTGSKLRKYIFYANFL